MATYPPALAVLERGAGAYVWDVNGRRYIDMIAGVAVTSLGHAHPRIAAAIADQAQKLVAVSNYFDTREAQAVARMLNELHGGGGRTFFANSGAEANECALKLARRHGGPSRPTVLTARRSFHGRTMATLAATGQEDKQRPFRPLPPSHRHFAFGDVGALEAHLAKEDVGAVLIEPVQAEGGVNTADLAFWGELQRLCRAHDVLLMVDEVQTGLGRTGSWFAYQQLGLEPDVVTMAKALANGIPVGACWAKEPVADLFAPGMHGSTIGGQPLAMRAAAEVLTIMNEQDVPGLAAESGEGLRSLAAGLPGVCEVRGMGLLLGVDFGEPVAAQVQQAAAQRGVLVSAVTPSTIRLTPSLLINAQEMADAAAGLRESLEYVWRDGVAGVSPG